MPENLSRAHDALDSLDDLSQDVNDSKFDDYLEEHFRTKRQLVSRFQSRCIDSKQDDDSFNLVELLGLMNSDESNDDVFDFPEDDINGNGVPDYFEEDLDDDGIPDFLQW